MTDRPYDAALLLAFLGAHAVPGIETYEGRTYARTLRLPHGAGIMRARPLFDGVEVGYVLEDARDEAAARAAMRALLAVDAPSAGPALAADPLLAPLVAARPGVRVPGDVDPAETAVRTVLGQQVSLAGARTVTGRIVAIHGDPLPPRLAEDGLTSTFPTAATLAAADPATLPLPKARIRALIAICTALANGSIVLERGHGSAAPRLDPAATARALLALPGVGPWTAGVISLRALGDPDVWLPTDLGVRRGLERLGLPGDPVSATALAERWRPHRSLALMHLWYLVVLARTGDSTGSADLVQAHLPPQPAVQRPELAEGR